jgi:hypothetical protein
MIDALDRKLIQELQKSGRRGYVELAKELGVVEGTKSACAGLQFFKHYGATGQDGRLEKGSG